MTKGILCGDTTSGRIPTASRRELMPALSMHGCKNPVAADTLSMAGATTLRGRGVNAVGVAVAVNRTTAPVVRLISVAQFCDRSSALL